MIKYSPLGFLITIFATYYGARNGMPWLGLILLAANIVLFLPFSPFKERRVLLMLAVGAAGFFLDSLLILLGIYYAESHGRWLLPHFSCPEWILALWLNFGLALFVFRPMLSRTRITPVVVGLIFAAMIYANASRMGLISFNLPPALALGIIAVCYAVFIPACNHLANKLVGGDHDGRQG